ncbi:unnamed protein product [Heterosigma akashiwo]
MIPCLCHSSAVRFHMGKLGANGLAHLLIDEASSGVRVRIHVRGQQRHGTSSHQKIHDLLAPILVLGRRTKYRELHLLHRLRNSLCSGLGLAAKSRNQVSLDSLPGNQIRDQSLLLEEHGPQVHRRRLRWQDLRSILLWEAWRRRKSVRSSVLRQHTLRRSNESSIACQRRCYR